MNNNFYYYYTEEYTIKWQKTSISMPYSIVESARGIIDQLNSVHIWMRQSLFGPIKLNDYLHFATSMIGENIF